MVFLNRDFERERLRELFDQALRRAPRAVTWALSALIAVQLVSFGRWWLSLADTRRVPVVTAASPAGIEALSHQITAARLFGSAPMASARDGGSADDAARQYALKGIVYLGTSGDGFAILASHDGKSKTFRTGESIADGLLLHEVSADYVLLEEGSQLTRLTLPRGTLALALASRTAAGGSASPPPPASLSDDTRATLETFGLNVIADSSGAISGLSGRGSESWHRSGLLPTDVIVAIDGTPVRDLLQQPYAIDRAGVAAVTVLTILRDGVPTTIEAEPPHPTTPARRRIGG